MATDDCLLVVSHQTMTGQWLRETFFLINSDIGMMNAILVSLVVCVHINSIFGIDRGEYKICSQTRRNRRTQSSA